MKKCTKRRSGNNFWQQKLVDADVSLKDMAELLNCSYKYTVAYFTGFVHPSVETIETICSFLDIPYDIGLAKFDEIYKAWGEAHKTTYAKFGNTYKKIKDIPESVSKSGRKAVKLGFWNHKVGGSGMTYSELADKLGKPYSTVKSYFSGFVMPDATVIKNICILFNVDYDRGYQEFLKIHEAWGIAHADKYEQSGNSYKIIKPVSHYGDKVFIAPATRTESKKSVVVSSPKDSQSTINSKTHNILECQHILYGKLSCDDFVQSMTMTTSYTDLLKFVYRKVDYDTFMALL